MSLSNITNLLPGAGSSMSQDAWAADEEMRGEKVALTRAFMDGDQDSQMTPEQRYLLNVKNSGTLNEFNGNFCPPIVNTMLDRLTLTGIETDNDTATAWVKELLERVRIDGLQVDAHEATLVDGNSFLMIDAVRGDDNTNVLRWTHEPAFDGSYGTSLIYETAADRAPMVAIKQWRVTTKNLADTVRVNIYYADHIERFISNELGSDYRVYEDDDPTQVVGFVTTDGRRLDYPVLPWINPRTREPLGVPFVHFKNAGSAFSNYGVSALEDVIPYQRAYNATMAAGAAGALFTGFPILMLVGGQLPTKLAPGVALNFFAKNKDGSVASGIDEDVLRYYEAIRLERTEGADLTQFIELMKFYRSEAYAVTNTPTDDAGADVSGESLKQRDVKLLGKIQRFQVRNGNAWEDAVRLSVRVADAFATPAPEFTRLTAIWDSGEVRNDSLFVADMLSQYKEGVIDHETYLEAVSPVYGWNDEKIKTILKRTAEARGNPANQINPQDASNVEALLANITQGEAQPDAA